MRLNIWEANEKLRAFLRDLEASNPWDYTHSVPGILGTWQVRDLLEGIELGALVIGVGRDTLVLHVTNEHGKTGGNCPCCTWYRRIWARERSAPPARIELHREADPLRSAFGLEVDDERA